MYTFSVCQSDSPRTRRVFANAGKNSLAQGGVGSTLSLNSMQTGSLSSLPSRSYLSQPSLNSNPSSKKLNRATGNRSREVFSTIEPVHFYRTGALRFLFTGFLSGNLVPVRTLRPWFNSRKSYMERCYYSC